MTSPLERLTVSVSIFFCSMLISFLSCSWTVTCWASWLLCKSCKFLVWSSSSWRTLLSLWLWTMRCCWKSFCCCLYRFLGQNWHRNNVNRLWKFKSQHQPALDPGVLSKAGIPWESIGLYLSPEFVLFWSFKMIGFWNTIAQISCDFDIKAHLSFWYKICK